MTVVAVIEVDLQCNALERPSRALEAWDSTCVLGRVLQRLSRSACLDEVVVVAPPRDLDRLSPVIAQAGARLEAAQCPDVPFRRILRRSRLWALEGWRGGIGGMTVFDEQPNLAELARVADETGAEVLVSVPAEAPLIDPEILDRLVADHRQHGGQVRFTFTTAPPGLAPVAFRPVVLQEFREARQTPGFLLKYYPSKPMPDLIDQPCTFKLETALVASPWRYLADSGRGLARCRGLAALVGDGGARQVVGAMAAHPELWPGPLARDIEVEITTQRQIDDPFLPSGPAVGSRGPMSAAQFRELAEAIGRTADDVVLTFGGFGDPLLHPELVEMIAAASQAGLLGTAVATDGLSLEGELLDRLIASPLDAVVVRLDAHTAPTYRRLKSVDAFDRVVANLHRFVARRKEANRSQPFLIVQMTKTRDNLAEMPDFFDHWMTHADWATLVGPTTYAGTRPDRAVLNMAPPRRSHCRRLFTRLLILSDGTVPLCSEDFSGRTAVGNVFEEPIGAIWRGQRLEARRAATLAAVLPEPSFCGPCQEWHRP